MYDKNNFLNFQVIDLIERDFKKFAETINIRKINIINLFKPMATPTKIELGE